MADQPHSNRVTPPSPPVQTPVAPQRPSPLAFCSGHLESDPTDVLLYLGLVYILPVKSLESLLLPVFVSREGVKERCVDPVNGRWTSWPMDPAEHESSAFDALPRLFQCIVEDLSSKPTSKLINNPTKSRKSERSHSFLPDGYLLRDPASFAVEKRKLDKNSTEDFWEDIAVPLEYKNDSTDADRADNERKIIWSMHCMLRNDPCRRFTFGITIENTDTRVWLFNRAATYVSEAFNFIQDQDTMIHLVLSLTLAEVYRLGWDPTLRRKRVGSTMVYEIDVPCGDNGEFKTFTADKIISDFGAELPRSRGTQVFRATRTDGSSVVVKTVWRDYDRAKEGVVLQDIRAKMQSQPDVDYEADKKLFLSVICHGDVQIHGQVDHTLDLVMRGVTVPPDCDTLQVPLPGQTSKRKRPESHRGSVGNVPHVGIDAHINVHMGGKRATGVEVGHRIQYRIVFVELGVSLHDLFNSKHMFQALTNAARALKIMFQCGYVHRDISSGNILYFDGRGMLADLEYAKRPSDDAHHDVRTGTLYFIAVEVLQQGYLFQRKRVKTELVFKHNPLHDLESLWWVAVWALLTRCIKDSSDRGAQHRKCSEIFSGDSNAAGRLSILLKPHIFGLRIQTVLPQQFQKAADSMDTALEEIIDRYEHAEKGPNIDASAFDGAHDAVYKLFVEATKACPGAVISLDSVVSESEERSAKRLAVG